MKADRVLASADVTTRRQYDLRAARSEPALVEEAPRAPELTPTAGE